MKSLRNCLVSATLLLPMSCGVFDASYVTYRDPADVAAEVANAPYAVREVRVTVPETLRVSEANVYYPIADIVWRGDPLGNRYKQVAAIFRDSIAKGTSDLTRGRPVVADMVVTRFHALTEKTRYSVGGVYSIKFDLTIRDAASGAVIEGPRPVNADIPAIGGTAALAEEMQGRSERVVIVEGLSQSIRRIFLTPAAE
jgi:hypothetical protein